MDKKVLIAFIVALIAIIVVGFVALRFVPTGDLIKEDAKDNVSAVISDNKTNDTEVNLTVENITNATENATDLLNATADANATNDTADIAELSNMTSNNSSSSVDSGDVLHKQSFTITENQTGQNEGMEPGNYVMYYTENDGIIRIDKVA